MDAESTHHICLCLLVAQQKYAAFKTIAVSLKQDLAMRGCIFKQNCKLRVFIFFSVGLSHLGFDFSILNVHEDKVLFSSSESQTELENAHNLWPILKMLAMLALVKILERIMCDSEHPAGLVACVGTGPVVSVFESICLFLWVFFAFLEAYSE